MLRHMHILTLLTGLSLTLMASVGNADVEYVNNGRGNVPVYVPSTMTAPNPSIDHGTPWIQRPECGWLLRTGPAGGQQTVHLLRTERNERLHGRTLLEWNGHAATSSESMSTIRDIWGLIELVQAQYEIDASSIHVTGISNGGFMSYRMACDHADLIASIVPIAGTSYLDTRDYTRRTRPCPPHTRDPGLNHQLRRRVHHLQLLSGCRGIRLELDRVQRLRFHPPGRRSLIQSRLECRRQRNDEHHLRAELRGRRHRRVVGDDGLRACAQLPP